MPAPWRPPELRPAPRYATAWWEADPRARGAGRAAPVDRSTLTGSGYSSGGLVGRSTSSRRHPASIPSSA